MMKPRIFLEFFARRLLQVRRGSVAVLPVILACAASVAFAQGSYPNRPVKLIIGFSPGGGVDAIGRGVAKDLSALWGQPVVVENKLGAAGIISVEATMKAAPDGYTLLLTTDSQMVAVPFLQARPGLQDKPPYDALTDLTPIALVGGFSMVLVAHPSLKVETLAELIAAAKARPGAIDYSSAGVGTSPHLVMEVFQRVAGIKLNHIAYKGGAPALQDVLAGHVPITWGNIATAQSHIQAGNRLVALAVGSLERSALLPNVPTVAELGFPGFEAGNWVAVMGPAKLPEALVRSLHADLQKVTQTAAYRERLTALGSESRSSTREEFAKRIREESGRNKALLAKAGELKN